MKRYAYIVVFLLLLATGSFLAGSWYTHLRTISGDPFKGRRILYYVDPTNPSHTSDKPGIGPGGMKMEPVYADEGTTARASSDTVPSGTVKISPEKEQTIGVKVATVERVLPGDNC